jgi:hypothetical protein
VNDIVPQEIEPPSIPESFAIEDASSANWLVRKIVEARAYAKHVKAWADMEVRRAERDEQFFLQRFGHQLEAWAKGQIAKGRSKSVKLPAGTVGFRIEPPRLDITNEQRLIGWYRTTLPGAIRIETRVLKSVVKDHLEQTGECPDGVSIAGRGQKFYVR